MQKRTFMAPNESWKSKAYLEGYACRGSRRENPYDKFNADVNNKEANAWDHGWLARFYGETI